jgi:uncharacterized protein (TIGR00725 family)
MRQPTHTVTVFGSARVTPEDPEYRLASALGRLLAEAGFAVCNGGYGGVMEASARGAAEAGGQTTGILCSIFSNRTANRWVGTIVMTDSLMDRIGQLVERGDAYIVLRGGTGTLLEFAAVWELINKRMMSEKPIVLIGPFWESVVTTLRAELEWEGLGDCTRFIAMTTSAEECVRVLREQLKEGKE